MLRVCVVGSLNMDLVVKAARLPQVGETVVGASFATFPGGKGGNQAVAAARLGAQVHMVGRVGPDAFGRSLVDSLRQDGVDVTHVHADAEQPTGVAFIIVDERGRNTILVAAGANMRLRPEDVEDAAPMIASAQVLLLQLEVPLDAVARAAAIGRKHGLLVCLDPAPAVLLPREFYPAVDVINPNEAEARVLTGVEIPGVEAAGQAAAVLLGRGVRMVVIKLGERGAVYLSGTARGHVPAMPVTAVDTTAAGDAFAAALGVALGEGRALPDAVLFATRVAGLKVTRLGARSLPTRAEVEAGR